MGRRRPMCCDCGGKLTAADSITIQFQAIPGKPCVGNHERCSRPFDGVGLKSCTRAEIVARLLEIQTRGEDRLVVGKRWREVIQ